MGPAWLSTGIGGLGAALVAVAAFLSGRAQADNRSTNWTRSRSAAESLKSGIILYRVSAPPFDGADLTAYLKNQQYQVLIAMYNSTALRLELLAGEWAASGKSEQDKAERDTFIKSCEETMSTENGSWMGLWSKLDKTAHPRS